MKVADAEGIPRPPDASEPRPGERRAMSARKPMSTKARVLYTSIAAGALGAFTLAFISHISDSTHPVIEQQPSVAMYTMYADQSYDQYPARSRVEDGKIIVPLTILLEKKLIEYDYQAPTTVVPLLAYISNEGKLVTSIRFCEPCNSKTFKIEGTELHCGNCTTRWNLDNLQGISGSCQKYPPAPIPSEIVGNEIHIDEKLVSNWRSRL